MFTNNELQALAQLLQRVSLQGNEAITVANLQIKINRLLEEKPETKNEKQTDNSKK